MSNVDTFVYKISVAIGVPKNALVFRCGGNMVPEIDFEI